MAGRLTGKFRTFNALMDELRYDANDETIDSRDPECAQDSGDSGDAGKSL